jgi:hypothetical protein
MIPSNAHSLPPFFRETVFFSKIYGIFATRPEKFSRYIFERKKKKPFPAGAFSYHHLATPSTVFFIVDCCKSF